MRRLFAVVAFVSALSPAGARAQGAILEDFENLRTLPPQVTRAVLPAKFDLAGKIPPPRRQSETSSCVSWSATYAAASLALRGQFADLTLSPSFTYNQAARDATCQTGTLASRTLDLLKTTGALPIGEFAFDAGFCGRLPAPDELQRAAKYRIKGWSAFDAKNLELVKQQIVNGAAVIFGMRSGPALRSLKAEAILERDEPTGEGHSMVAIGYDEAKQALMIQNSWGSGWGSNGYGWIAYDLWKSRVRTAYVIQ